MNDRIIQNPFIISRLIPFHVSRIPDFALS